MLKHGSRHDTGASLWWPLFDGTHDPSDEPSAWVQRLLGLLPQGAPAMEIEVAFRMRARWRCVAGSGGVRRSCA